MVSQARPRSVDLSYHLNQAANGSGSSGLNSPHVDAVADVASGSHDAVIQSGWLLKKGRKKLQGYARRHFSLTASGILSYRLSPTQPVRGERCLKNVSVAAGGKLRQITIDGGNTTGSADDEIWHLKCLSSEDWTDWMTGIRRFILDPEVRSVRAADGRLVRSPTASMRLTAAQFVRSATSLGALAAKLAPSGIGAESRASRSNVLLDQMGKIMEEMEKAISSAHEEDTRPPNFRKWSHGKLGSKKEGQNGRDSHSHKEKEKEHAKERERDGFFAIFHRRPSQHTPPQSSHDIPTLSTSNSAGISPSPSLSPSSTSIPQLGTTPFLASLSASLATLRSQHAQLLSLLSDPSQSRPPTVYESDPDASPHADRRRSLLTVGSNATEDPVWFDADDWDAEEIVLDAEEGESEEFEEFEVAMALDEEGEEEDEGKGSVRTAVEEGAVVKPEEAREARRTRLPVPVTGEEGSLWAVLRKNVGKDLSTISFPVSFNEPLSLLQKLAEEMEYTDLLSRAVAATDPVERLCLVSAFAVSTYASTHYRSARKPFNPMLGETFEEVRPSTRFIAEKVQHHPPVMASYAEGEGWTYWATFGGKNKFWGRSLEIIPVGTTHLKIGSDHYQWQKPSSFMRNLMAGQKYIEHVGTMTIEDSRSKLHCDLDFKDAGFWGSTRNAVSGVVRSSTGQALAHLEGTWHESFSRRLDESGDTLNVLWRATPMPAHAEQYYGFTAFAMQLNELLPSMAGLLPPTDSRLRPDQRALEEGRVDEADEQKLRLEVAQRARRKAREENGETWHPKWFKRTQGREDEWEYNGGYWEARQRRDWEDPGLW